MTSEKLGKFVGTILGATLVAFTITATALLLWSFVSWQTPHPENLNAAMVRFIFACGFVWSLLAFAKISRERKDDGLQ